MFNSSDVRELLIAKEFKPFAIHTTDGVRYEITNHDMVMVGRNSIMIGLTGHQEGIAERFVRCAIIHITRIEEMQAA